jgi:hypothetical protein
MPKTTPKADAKHRTVFCAQRTAFPPPSSPTLPP